MERREASVRDEMIDRICDRVDPGVMMEHLAVFARFVKLSGTAEELESFRYLESTLRSYGYRTELTRHDAYISLPGAARVVVDGLGFRCITHSFSRPSPADGTTGPLVHVGAGTDADFAAADVRGKIALVEGLAAPGPSLRASRAGAIGQIHVSPHEHLHEMCISPVWGSPTHETLERMPRTVVTTIPKADGEGLKRRLRGGETVTATLHAAVDTGWRKTPLLVADLPGPDASVDEPFILFSGHHDTWYYGVMDNGAANATMLEVARLCTAEQAHWRRGLRLCFWSGHSHGRYSGSTWYADNHWSELEQRCAAHVNCDSTGARGNVVLADTPVSSELKTLGAEAVRRQGGQEITGLRMSRAGDGSFWGVGIPSLFMGMGEQPAGDEENVAGGFLGSPGEVRKGAGFGWWWHTPDDTLDKIDPALLGRDTRIYVHAIWRLLTDPVLPLDYATFSDDLDRVLADLAVALGERLDLRPLRDRLSELRECVTLLDEATSEPERHRQVNATLMKLGRALVPIDYTRGDRFEHDPALPQPPYPSLDPLRALARVPPDSDEAKFLSVAAVRALNRVGHAIGQAVLAAEIPVSGDDRRPAART
jgi:hypothetical protein